MRAVIDFLRDLLRAIAAPADPLAERSCRVSARWRA